MRFPRQILVGLMTMFAFSAGPKAEPTKLVSGLNDLGFELLRRIIEARPNQNVLLSPLSLGLTLALVEQGADAEADRELAALMRVTGMDREAIRAAARNLRETISKEAEI